MDRFLWLSVLALSVLRMTLGADTAAWKSRNIYFVLTDRLARDNDTGGPACQDLSTYCGGTFEGLQSKLGYIQGMGFDAIWITPVVTNSENGYHGYWAQDLDSINSHYGTAGDLKSFVNAAHDLGMYVMVDVVANHMGYANISQDGPTLMTQNSSYHPYCNIDFNNETSITECWISGLPDVYTEKDEIRSLYQNWVKNLVSTYGFDGLRIDTVREVEKEFWQLFVNAAGVYAVGEVFDGDASYVGGYQSAVPGLLNYPMYYPLNAFYQQKGSSQAVVDMFDNITASFTDPTALGNFVDNHDNPRFLSQKNDQQLLENALTYAMLSRGIPIVYYGTEQAYNGTADPDNREDLWHSYYNTSTDLYSTISKLSSARKTAGGLSGDDQVFLLVEDTGLVWSRNNGSLIAITSNSGTGSSKSYCFDSRVPNGAWTDVLGGDSHTASSNGSICATTVNGAPLVLLASNASSSGSSSGVDG